MIKYIPEGPLYWYIEELSMLESNINFENVISFVLAEVLCLIITDKSMAQMSNYVQFVIAGQL